MESHVNFSFFSIERSNVIETVGRMKALQALSNMVLIRQFEITAEACYHAGKVGGFFHSYIGQEAIQTAAVAVMGNNQWYTTAYRCHALALLLEIPPEKLMAELFGKATGIVKGRGGSPHFFSDRLLGGHGIVGGQIPIATGAAFTCKYLENNEISICFLGDGAVAQGSFHESLNLASLMNLPCIYVVENNKWGMGTSYTKAIANSYKFLESAAVSYGLKFFRLDGMDFFHCFGGFEKAFEYCKKNSRPVLIECLTERFKGHSISDPGLYRSKDDVKLAMERDPIVCLKSLLLEKNWLSIEEYLLIEREKKEEIRRAVTIAENDPFPTMEESLADVFAPEDF